MKNKGFGFYFTLGAAVCSLLSGILFGVSRENKFFIIVLLLALATIAGILVAIKPVKFTEMIPFALNAVSTGMILWVLLNNLADIMAKNNVIGLSGTYVASIVFASIAMIASAVALVAIQKKD